MARRRLTPAQPGYTVAHDAAIIPATGGPGTRLAPIAQVSGQSAEAAALREMADGIQTARDEGRMIVDVPLADVSPGFLIRDRIILDREELNVLKASMQEHGQRTPAEITPLRQEGMQSLARGSSDVPEASEGPVYRFGLISGWRRLTALNELYTETGDPRFSTLRSLIRQSTDAADSYVAMIEENEIRVGLSYFERARMVSELTRCGVFADHTAALRALFAAASRAKRSKIGSFVDLVDSLGDVLKFPAEIPERLGLALVARLRQDSPAVGQRMRNSLIEAAPKTAAAEIALLERLSRPQKADETISKAPKQEGELLRPGLILNAQQKKNNLTLTLSGEAVDSALFERVRLLLRQV